VASDDELLSYIKDSVDKLHEKVDTGFTAVDGRLKELEIEKARVGGYRAAGAKIISVIWGLLGGVCSSIVTWAIYAHKQ